MLPMNHLVNVFKRSVKEYGQDDAADLAAALAFAAFFSIFPLVLFLVSLASFILDPNSAREFVLSKLPNIQQQGQDANFLAKTVTDIIASRGAGTGIAAIIGLISLLMSASGVFATLQKAINRAWDCEKEGGLIKDKVVAFLMVLGVAVVMVISTIISSALNWHPERDRGHHRQVAAALADHQPAGLHRPVDGRADGALPHAATLQGELGGRMARARWSRRC